MRRKNEVCVTPLFIWQYRIISIFAYNYLPWCIWPNINILNSVEEQGFAAELKNDRTMHWRRKRKNTCILFAVTFHDVTASYCHESFVYKILWLSGFELAPSHVRSPGFKFQYGAWLSWHFLWFSSFLPDKPQNISSNFVSIVQSGVLKASFIEPKICKTSWY